MDYGTLRFSFSRTSEAMSYGVRESRFEKWCTIRPGDQSRYMRMLF